MLKFKSDRNVKDFSPTACSWKTFTLARCEDPRVGVEETERKRYIYMYIEYDGISPIKLLAVTMMQQRNMMADVIL